jgi:hypothetical protein
MRRILSFAILALVLTAAAAVPARAAGLAGAGLQIGWANSPDLFLVGLHWQARPMGEELDLVPSLDFGFGDNLLMIAPNIDAHYVLKTSSKLKPYLGAGMSFPWYDFDNGGSEWEFGGALIGGVHINPNMAFEAKYGLGDAPDWKFVFLLHK